MTPTQTEIRAVLRELRTLHSWVRTSDDISKDDAREDIARGIENHMRYLETQLAEVKRRDEAAREKFTGLGPFGTAEDY